MNYYDLLLALAIDLVAILLLAGAVYYRRHRRRDLLMAYIALNVALFVVVTVLSRTELDVAVGFGLFAILTIIRLRSDAVTQEEVAYYFVALAIGLVNGIGLADFGQAILLSVILVVVMAALEALWFTQDVRRRVVTLDVVHPDEAALAADLERRLDATVLHHVVTEVDYVRDITVVDVRFRVRRRVGRTQGHLAERG